jgi:hypothetical protein
MSNSKQAGAPRPHDFFFLPGLMPHTYITFLLPFAFAHSTGERGMKDRAKILSEVSFHSNA